VRDEIAPGLNLPAEAVSDIRRSDTPRLQSQLSFAKTYLKAEGLIDSYKRGVWTLTEKGKRTRLSVKDALAITSHWDEVWRK
jgi:restriction system protein